MNDVADIRFEPPVGVEVELCCRYRCTKSGCSACAEVCPVPGAVLMLDQGPEISDACVACGACASACPNGALRLIESDQTLTERIQRRVRHGHVFRIACGRAEGRADLVLQCLGRLTEALVLEPLRGGAEHVELLDPDCAGCALRKAAPQWEKILMFSRALCESAGLDADRICRVGVATGRPVEVRGPEEFRKSRRALFRAMADPWTSGEALAAPRSAGPESFREIVRHHRENPKRAALLQVLENLPVAKVVPNAVPAAIARLADLEIGHQCVGCNVCETLCPTQALRHRETDGCYALDFDAALCTGCGVCAAACFHKAIRMRETVDVSALFARSKVTLISGARQTCNACRETFLGASPGLCPLCQVSDRRRAMVARRILFGEDPR